MLCPKKYGKNIPTMDKEEILQIPIILQIHIQPLLRTYLLVDLENIYIACSLNSQPLTLVTVWRGKVIGSCMEVEDAAIGLLGSRI